MIHINPSVVQLYLGTTGTDVLCFLATQMTVALSFEVPRGYGGAFIMHMLHLRANLVAIWL